MSDEIKAGDLVRVAKPFTCCGRREGIGEMYYVSVVVMAEIGDCIFCGLASSDMIAIEAGTNSGWPVCRLVRIDPPSLDGESTETNRELEAT